MLARRVSGGDVLLFVAWILAGQAAEPPARFGQRLTPSVVSWASVTAERVSVGSVARRGDVTVWRFPDGVPARVDLAPRGVSAHRWELDIGGRPAVEIAWDAGSLTTGRLLSAGEAGVVSLVGWRTVAVPGSPLRVSLPGEPVDGTVAFGDGRFRVALLPAGDPLADDVRAEIEASAGGTIVASTSAWLGRQPAVRYTLDLPDPDVPQVAEMWLARTPDGVAALVWVAPLGKAPASVDTLAPGRVAAALASWETP